MTGGAYADTVSIDRAPGTLLSTIHEDIYEENLHGVKGVAEPEERAHGNQAEGGHRSTELERQEVLDIMENRFA